MSLAQDAMLIGGAVLVGIIAIPKLLESVSLEDIIPSLTIPSLLDDLLPGDDGVPAETPEARAARLILEAQQAADAADRDAAYRAQVAAEAAHAAYCAALDPYSRDMDALTSCHMPLLPLPVQPPSATAIASAEAWARAEAARINAELLASTQAVDCVPGAQRCVSGYIQQCRRSSPTTNYWMESYIPC